MLSILNSSTSNISESAKLEEYENDQLARAVVTSSVTVRLDSMCRVVKETSTIDVNSNDGAKILMLPSLWTKVDHSVGRFLLHSLLLFFFHVSFLSFLLLSSFFLGGGKILMTFLHR